ncbi:MAG: winged helix-turn-helix domain-containing protein [Thermoguttaceae bacterium]
MIENNPTNLVAAFEMLLEEIEAEIEFTNKVGARAFEARDYERAREALERAAQIVAFRGKADSLRCEWDNLMGRTTEEDEEEGRTERRDLGRLARGLRTPERTFRLPILRALVDLGGAGPMAEVLEKVRQAMERTLKDVDYQPLASDPDLTRWRNTAQWSRAAMVKEGLIEGNSRRGIWEISDAGRQFLQRQSG